MGAIVSHNHNDTIQGMACNTAQDIVCIEWLLAQARVVAHELTDLHVDLRRSFAAATFEIEVLINECEDLVETAEVYVFAQEQLSQLASELLTLQEQAAGVMLDSVQSVNHRAFVPQEQAAVMILEAA